MKKTVFYSWQSDLPNASNRSFIENALKDAAKEIIADDNIDIEPVIDRDTLGAIGAPDISVTIFSKIASAELFVADISFIGKVKNKCVPNPNVLIELGYALHAKGSEALILIFNTAYGKLERLPFDLKMKRILTYNATEGEVDRSVARMALTRDLKAALLAGFSRINAPTKPTPITDIIRQNPADKIIHIRKYLNNVLTDLDKLQPLMNRDGGTADKLIEAIKGSESTMLIFAELAETIVLMNDNDSSKEIFQWFGKILDKYHPAPNASGRTSNADGDFFRFVGNELFVMFISPFLREGRLETIREILNGTLRVSPQLHRNTDSTRESWHKLSEWLPSLADESRSKNRKSVHDDLLRSRHSVGPLSHIVPLREYQDADFFLFLHGSGITQDEYRSRWCPQSILLAEHTPEFIKDSKNNSYALHLCRALQVADVDELKLRLLSSARTLRYDWHSPISEKDVQLIGTDGLAKIISKQVGM